ncbi:hypothetical protein Nmel_003955 [Mimus melanotis]
MVSWEDKLITQNVPPSSFFFPLYTLSIMSYGLGSPVLTMSPPNLPDGLNFLTSAAIQKALALCKPCSAITNISWYYQLCVQHKSRAQPQ